MVFRHVSLADLLHQAPMGEEEALDFTFFLPSITMRHVCFESLGKSDLLDEALPLMAMVAMSSLSDSELSSLVFHS
jgi:hypothetical protein